MKQLVNLSAACILSLTVALGSALRTESVTTSTPQNDLSFGLALFQQIAGKSEKENVIISPSSAYTLLSMVANGANEDTLKQLLNALGNKGSLTELDKEFKSQKQSAKPGSGQYTLESANAIYVDKSAPVLQNFNQATKTLFGAEAQNEDFADRSTVTKINQWCSDRTHGKITSIIDTLRKSDLMILVNALYFKGKWVSQFKAEATKTASFTAADGVTKQVKMMTQESNFAYCAGTKFTSIKMPYAGHEVSMLIFLPDKSSSLSEFLTSLTPANWARWRASYRECAVNVHLPKFKLEYRRRMEQDLLKLGVRDAFDAAKADFSKMFGASIKAHISVVIQKTYVDVNEEGTEAAAVTAVSMSKDMFSGPPKAKQFIVDRPFAFALVNDKTGQLLFLGAINDPQK